MSPVKIIQNESEANDAQFVVCMRVVDVPIPPQLSAIGLCSDCGQRIWIAQSTPRVAAPLICMQCIVQVANRRIVADGEEPTFCVTDHQLDVLAEYIKQADKKGGAR